MADPVVPRPRGGTARRVASAVLSVVAALVALVAVVAGHVEGNLLSTDRYVELIAPLADDPVIEQAVATAVTDAVVDRVRVDELTDQALESLGVRDTALGRLLGPALQNQLDATTRRLATRVVDSDTFGEVWVSANRTAHGAAVSALRGGGAVVDTTGGRVEVNLSPVVEEVRARLAAGRLPVADLLPATDASLVLVESEALARAQGWVAVVDRLAAWAPWLFLLLGAAAVVVAPDRGRAGIRLAAVVASALALGLVVLAVARTRLLDGVSGDRVDPAVAAVLFDTLNEPLAETLGVLLAVALFVLVAGIVLRRVLRQPRPASD